MGGGGTQALKFKRMFVMALKVKDWSGLGPILEQFSCSVLYQIPANIHLTSNVCHCSNDNQHQGILKHQNKIISAY